MGDLSMLLDETKPSACVQEPVPSCLHHSMSRSPSTAAPRLSTAILKGLCSGIRSNQKVISPPKVWILHWRSSDLLLLHLPARIKLNPLKKENTCQSLSAIFFFLHNIQDLTGSLSDLWLLSLSGAPRLIHLFLPSKQIYCLWPLLTPPRPGPWSKPLS